MPDMPDTAHIQPALTAEEWAKYGSKYAFATGSLAIHGAGQTCFAFDDGHGECEWHALVALANDALPDDHPNKFTTEDIEALDYGRHGSMESPLPTVVRPSRETSVHITYKQWLR